MKRPVLKLEDLWHKLTAAEARSSQTWLLSMRFPEGIRVYSPALGPLRRIVDVASLAHQAFGEYVAAFDPGTTRRLLDIVQAASELKDIHLEPPARTLETVDDRTNRLMAALKKLVEALQGVEIPK